MDFLNPRLKQAFGPPEMISLAGFCALLAWSIPRHESWFDEAQAWLIARDSSLGDLLIHRLHYEGSPALWHLLLWSEIRLHVSFMGMHYITGLFAAAGIYIWLRFNPLPRFLSLLIPFSFFLQYQFAVVARSYVLCPLFAFTLMALYQNRKSSTMLFCVVAGLMANCSFHMFAFAVGFSLWYGWDRSHLSSQRTADLKRFAAPVLVLLLFLGLATATAWPTADGDFGNQAIEMVRAATHRSGTAIPQPAEGTSAQSPEQHNQPAATQGNPNQSTEPRGRVTPGFTLFIQTLARLFVLLTELTAPVSTSNVLALMFLVLLGLNLRQESAWASLLPFAFVLLAGAAIEVESQHLGVLWVALLCSLWDLYLRPIRTGRARNLRLALVACASLVVALQIGWSVYCVRFDIVGSYSGYKATADYIRQLPPGKRVASFDSDPITVNAYLPHSPYFNQQVDYWPYSKTKDPGRTIDQVMAQRPDFIIAAGRRSEVPFINQWVVLSPVRALWDEDARLRDTLNKRGYYESRRFCGQHVFRNASEFADCGVVYEPVIDVPSAGP